MQRPGGPRGPTGAPSKVERVDGPFAQAPSRPAHGAGGAAGRGLGPGRSLEVGAQGPELVPAGPGRSEPRGGPAPAPFATYGPDARQMAGQVEGSRSQSMGVLAIVGGLLFMTVSVVIVALVVLLVSFFVFQVTRDDELAGKDGGKNRQIRDTGSEEPIQRERGGGSHVAGDPGDRTVGDPNAGPPPGPATVTVPNEMMFLSIEVNCPGGYRSRGKFKRISADMMSASVYDVPSDESCVVTFQGSEPAKANISGNQSKICKFNPTECYLQ
jgi:hypothetical protein